jgi:hypothetical protein
VHQLETTLEVNTVTLYANRSLERVIGRQAFPAAALLLAAAATAAAAVAAVVCKSLQHEWRT